MSQKMRVKKRDGTLVPVRLDEITDRIAFLSKDLDEKVIDPVKITLEVVEKIHDGILTSLIDSFAAEICHNKATEHPHFNLLAGKLIIGDHQKTVQIMANLKFSEVCKLLYTNTDQLGELCPLISEELYFMSQEYKDIIDNMIVNERDFLLDYFGFKTLMKSYLLKVAGKVIETPQHMFMRVALGIHGKFKYENKYSSVATETTFQEANFELIKETYDLLSMKYFTHATPTLYNAGTRHNQLFSCFLLSMDDSMDSIYKTLADTAQISKWSGGIGIHIHDVRGNGSYIRGTGGKSDGIIPMLKVYNDTARYVNQGGGKRSGSFAIYLEPWHPDIQDFLKLGLKHGDENRRARDLFYAMWIPDLFMERVKKNESWSLMCPSECPGLSNVYGKEFKKLYEKYEKEGRIVKTINAQDLWHEIIKSQIETGTPYMVYKDAANNKSNQKNVGTIKSSNLCVAPETRILTDKGYFPIKELKDKEVNVWNGKEWSLTTVKQTGSNQKLIEITLSNGKIINCTEYHKFIIEKENDSFETIEAKNLKLDMKLIKFDLPFIDKGINFEHAYIYGVYTSNYTMNINGHIQSFLIDKIVKKLGKEFKDITTTDRVKYTKAVPNDCNLESKIKWLEGIIDGSYGLDGKNRFINIDKCMTIDDNSEHFLNSVCMMLQTIGISSIVKIRKTPWRLVDTNTTSDSYYLEINSKSVKKLVELGLCPRYVKMVPSSSFPNIDENNLIKYPENTSDDITIISIKNNQRYDDTYCFTEEKRNMGMFEGVLLGNCSEIIEYSDTNKYACCVLASIVLPSYIVSDDSRGTRGSEHHNNPSSNHTTTNHSNTPIQKKKDEPQLRFDHEKLAEVVKVVTKNLNKLIDMNYYPVKETHTSNMSERPIGIGVQGLADVFFKLGLPYDSEEAIKLDREIMETIYYAALSASMELSKKEGPYATFKGSPISKGHFQFDLWKEFPTNKDQPFEIIHSGRYDWEKLRKDIKKHGVRNSLVTALMPTATTSQIMGSASESFEPITSNCYTRRVKAGEFLVINPYMTTDLIKLGLWDENMRQKLLANRGSIQNIPEIPQNLKDIYKTVWEIQQKVLIDHSIARGPYVDQSQSLNLYFADGNPEKITKAHFYGWSKGIKTGSYYIRTKPAINASSFTVEHLEEKEIKNSPKKQITGVDEEGCTSCGA